MNTNVAIAIAEMHINTENINEVRIGGAGGASCPDKLLSLDTEAMQTASWR